MCDWEGYTTGTIGLPNPNQRRRDLRLDASRIPVFVCFCLSRSFQRQKVHCGAYYNGTLRVSYHTPNLSVGLAVQAVARQNVIAGEEP